MEANCASIWSEESEMIACLQSMFWSSSNADSCLSSPNSSTSSFVENEHLDKGQCQNTGEVWCLDHRSLSSPNSSTNEVTGNKRSCLMDENKKIKNAKKPCTIPWVLRTNSTAPANEIKH